MITDNTHFVQLALRTESNDFPAIRARLLDRATQVAVLTLLSDLDQRLELLDTVKKHIFYGRESAFINEFKKKHEEKPFSPMPEITLELLDEKTIRTLHGVIGINTEGGELITALLKRFFHAVPFDDVNVMEEAGGDIPWYQAILADNHNYTFDQGFETVIKKLQKRFPGKFTEEHANNRDLTTERKVLEQGYTNG